MEHPTQNQFAVLAVRDTVIYPGITLPLRIGRPRSRAALEHALKRDQGWVVVVLQKPESEGRENPGPSDVVDVGVLCKVEKSRGTERGSYQALVRGVSRVRLTEVREHDGYLRGEIHVVADEIDTDPNTVGALLKGMQQLAREILELLPAETGQLREVVDGVKDLGFLTHLCAANLDLPALKKQEILETVSLKTRALKMLEILQSQKESLGIQGEIREKLAHKVGKAQREALLREQLRTIRSELGEEAESDEEEGYRKKIDEAGMPEDVRKVALDELKRMESIGQQSPESHVIRNYLDLLCALPWSKPAAGDGPGIDLGAARATLDADHYGLEKVKKRILQHLAVMKLKKSVQGSILLLVGPPGVGKTSLGQSVARALGRKFIRASLGGVRDDAEIRGHRRTYVGAMPGRIIQSLKRAGANNPVMLLDEIDKLSRSFAGDPAGALLEVLDPEQNSTFHDHYLDVPFDLSKVFFIATANSLETIPAPLLDRMEVIELSGYTTPEKLHIAKQHLVPKQMEANGVPTGSLVITDEALTRAITHYTREAGVRELQRVIATICRASSEKILDANGATITVGLQDLEEILGPERHVHEVAERVTPPGVVTGMAWTPQGGEILFIESSLMPGTGKLTITGQLGDVMKESAQIAWSLVRTKLPEWVPSFETDKRDLHIHVPSGAIPKDGPSAGVALVTSLASLYTGRTVSSRLAMTGEITLRGAVTPVGGIKEKVIGAHRAGVTEVILSRRNERDLRDVPAEVREQITFHLVDTVGEVLRIALGMEVGAGLGLHPALALEPGVNAPAHHQHQHPHGQIAVLPV